MMCLLAFDLDGTIITCEPRQSAVLRAALARCRIKGIDLEEVWSAKRNGSSTVDALIFLGLDKTTAQEVGLVWGSMIENPAWLAFDSCFSDSLLVLDAVRRQGFRTLLLTARQQPHWLRQQLIRLGIMEHFDTVEVVKPSAATAEKTQLLQSMNPLAFFGDTESDWLAAKKAEITFYALDRGQRSQEFLESLGNIHIFINLADAVSQAVQKQSIGN
jgi:phosphoglycolate phosphatase-like HAD superfamily hydrolase